MIQVENLKKTFGTKEVLKDISFEVEKGTTTIVMGPSGTGKSTVIKHIIGLLMPSSGKIIVDGSDITIASYQELIQIRHKIGFLFQSGALFDSMNIEGNIAFPLKEHTKISKKEIRKKVEEKLEMVGMKPSEIMHLMPSEISGGMQKRVGLARSIAMDPKIILYDEPTSGLDPISSDLISKLINKLRDELGATSVVISHDILECFKVADQMVMLRDGFIYEQGKTEIFKNSSDPYIKSFIEGIS